jgi:hypothetical protein
MIQKPILQILAEKYNYCPPSDDSRANILSAGISSGRNEEEDEILDGPERATGYLKKVRKPGSKNYDTFFFVLEDGELFSYSEESSPGSREGKVPLLESLDLDRWAVAFPTKSLILLTPPLATESQILFEEDNSREYYKWATAFKENILCAASRLRFVESSSSRRRNAIIQLSTIDSTNKTKLWTAETIKEEVSQILQKSNACELLVALLKQSGKNNEAVTEAGCKAITKMANANSNRFGTAGACELTADLLKHYGKNNENIAKVVFDTICILSYDADNKARFNRLDMKSYLNELKIFYKDKIVFTNKISQCILMLNV